jgi:hypothetical protein
MEAGIEGWRFKTEQRGRWVWQRVSDGGDVVSMSEADFPTIETCAVDAQRCGYGGVIADYASPG